MADIATRPSEYSRVELPFIEQLRGMDWQHVEGDTDVPGLSPTGRESFRDVLLVDRLKAALKRINLDESGREWLDESRLTRAVSALERLGPTKLMEANRAATELLLKGITMEPEEGDRDVVVHYIDFEHPERNEFLAVNQFRVDPPWALGRDFIVPDIVLFVNGIPLVVVECKAPDITNPMEEGITQLLRYSNQREEVEQDEGAEKLFHYNQFTVSTYFNKARAGTISAQYEHYKEWKDTAPVPMPEVAAALGREKLHSQEKLVAGMLRPEHLLDIVRNFSIYKQESGKTIKVVARYQQYRAVHKAIVKLSTGKTRLQHGETDQRGGIVWHTQGSGKSLTMVFLVRKMRTLPKLRRFKVVAVTDRKDLEDQLSATAELTGETVRKPKSSRKLKEALREKGSDFVFALIQKYRERDWSRARQRTVEVFPELNDSEEILVLVDEAHRSHASALHANLLKALPNSVQLGFTGTPIMTDAKRDTRKIFGDFIDRYRLRESEEDESTVPILYEGRTADAAVKDGRTLDKLFEDMFKDRSKEELAAIQARYATTGAVLEAEKMIQEKAEDMLRHYVDNALPNEMKAQVVAVSRLAAVRYQKELAAARDRLVAKLEALDPALLRLSSAVLARRTPETRFLVRAYAQLHLLRRIEFAAIISGKQNDDPAKSEWTDPAQQKSRIARFKKPLVHSDERKADPLSMLVVQSMLLVGFDAPVEQVLYLDRSMRGHELLQAIARVNRPYKKKVHGIVVDYVGVTRHLSEALAVYDADDIEGVMVSLKEELPRLDDRHKRVLAVFHSRGIPDIGDDVACVDLLRDEKVRAEFVTRLRQFFDSIDTVMPRPEVLPYLADARQLGYIAKSAANLYRDHSLNIIGVGNKVRRLIDEFIVSKGVDPKIPPVLVLDPKFDEVVEQHVSPRAKASEMEHALRHHITVHLNEDPVYFRKLSEKLEEILRSFKDNWEQLVLELRALIGEARVEIGPQPGGLDDKTETPFYRILDDIAPEPGQAGSVARGEIAELTTTMVEHIRAELRLVDFWRRPEAQNQLRAWIVQFLDDHDLVSFADQQRVADQVMELAKALHTRLAV
jgi:type I restriction enzyme R subunit